METIARITDQASFLASLDQAKRFLAACTSATEVEALRDKATAMQTWARTQKDAGELEIAAGELRIEATVRIGELEGPPATKAEAGARGGRGKLSGSTTALTRQEVHVARAVAAVPSGIRAKLIANAKARGEAPTIASVLAAGKTEARKAKAVESRKTLGDAPITVDDLKQLAKAEQKFASIYADPPWDYLNKGTRGTMANHYAGMPLGAICGLPVRLLAAENAHLHLWTTSTLLPEALQVMRDWGFEYKAAMIWIKTGRIGMGN